MVSIAPNTTITNALKRLAEIAATDVTKLRNDELGSLLDELNDITSECRLVFETKWLGTA